jgi:hypothetical protein
MNDKLIARIYMEAYFWLLLATQTLLVVFGTELDSPRGITNTVFTYLALIPFFGYIRNEKFPTKDLWRLFAALFSLWQVLAFFLLYDHAVKTKFMLFILLSPLYWGVVLYAMVTVEEDSKKKEARRLKVEAFKEKYRSIIAISSAFSMLLLCLSLFIMLEGRFKLLSGE